MGNSADAAGYPMRGALANDLFVAVHSTLAPVAELLAAMSQFGLGPGPVAAEVRVVADTGAPQKRFFLDEYYSRIAWTGNQAHVETNGATGSIEWSGSASDVLTAELRIYPEGAPESLGMFLRMLASMLLPSRRGVLVHASSVVIHEEAFIFLGDSGAGKTTTARRIGREGALRIADDLMILRVSPGQRVRAEPCAFDRGGRLPGRENRSWPVRASYEIRKGKAVTQDVGRVKDPLAAWCSSILSSTGPPTSLPDLLDLAAGLSRIVPPRGLHASPSGPVLPALLATARPEPHSVR